MGQDIGARDVDIVGFVEAIAEGNFASDVFNIEGGTCNTSV